MENTTDTDTDNDTDTNVQTELHVCGGAQGDRGGHGGHAPDGWVRPTFPPLTHSFSFPVSQYQTETKIGKE